MRIRLDADSDITGAALGVLQNTWKTDIEAAWNNPMPSPGAAAEQWKCARAGEVPCRVSFRVHWVIAGAHHAVAVHSGSGATDESDWYATDPGSTAAHEFGHMLGHPDEYAASNCEDRAPVATGTVMDNNSTFIPQRLVQFVADEIGSTLQ